MFKKFLLLILLLPTLANATVAFDNSSCSSAGTGTLTWTHTPIGTPRALIGYVLSAAGTIVAVDTVASFDYGGVEVHDVTTSPNAKLTNERSIVTAVFRGSGIPTGAQTVTVNVSETEDKIACVITLTAAADTTIVDQEIISNDSLSNPSTTLSLGGQTSFAIIGFVSGTGNVGNITPLGSWTSRLENLLATSAQAGAVYTYNTIGSTDVTAGYTGAADDVNLIALAITEGTPPTIAFRNVGNIGTATSISSGTTLSFTTVGKIYSGNPVACLLALDNTGSADGSTSEVTSITTASAGNFSFLGAFRNADGAAGGGVQTEIWLLNRATADITTGSTFTITYANSITSKAASCHRFTATDNLSVPTNGLNGQAVDGGPDVAAISLSGMTSGNYNIIRATGFEASIGGNQTPTSGCVDVLRAQANTGTSGTSITIKGEICSATSITGFTSDPALASTNPMADVIVALQQATVVAYDQSQGIMLQ